MKLVGYGRVSTGEQAASLSDQREDVEEFCGTSDDFQHGDEHELVEWFEDEGSSGSVFSIHRDGFQELIQYLEQHQDVDGIIVWDFDRFGREPVDQMSSKFILEEYEIGRAIEVIQVEPWAEPYRAIPPVTTKSMKEGESPLDEWNNLFLFMTQAMMDMRELLEISHRTKRSLRRKRQRGEPDGRTPRGITTDKQLLGNEDDRNVEAKMRVPAPDSFEESVEILNAVDRGESFYRAGKEAGISSPHGSVERMWKRRDEYKQALENARQHDEIRAAIDFDPGEVYISF